MRKLVIILVFAFLVKSCLFGDNPYSSTKITEDFWLEWFENSTHQRILFSLDGMIGNVIVNKTVFAVGYNDDFIIAKQDVKNENDSLQNNINYIIIDLRNYVKDDINSFDVHTLNERGFPIMREYLKVPADLDFKIIDANYNKVNSFFK